jgi:hypothetical protein
LKTEVFLKLLKNPKGVKEMGVDELRELALTYPYSQVVQLLYGMRLRYSSEHLFNQQLGRAAALSNDRSVLFELFENKPKGNSKALLNLQENIEESASGNTTAVEVGRLDSVEAIPVFTKPADKTLATEMPAVPFQTKIVSGRAVAPVSPPILPPVPIKNIELPAAKPEGLENLSPKDRVKAILEQNRLLRKQFEEQKRDPNAEEKLFSAPKQVTPLAGEEKPAFPSPPETPPAPEAEIEANLDPAINVGTDLESQDEISSSDSQIVSSDFISEESEIGNEPNYRDHPIDISDLIRRRYRARFEIIDDENDDEDSGEEIKEEIKEEIAAEEVAAETNEPSPAEEPLLETPPPVEEKTEDEVIRAESPQEEAIPAANSEAESDLRMSVRVRGIRARLERLKQEGALSEEEMEALMEEHQKLEELMSLLPTEDDHVFEVEITQSGDSNSEQETELSDHSESNKEGDIVSELKKISEELESRDANSEQAAEVDPVLSGTDEVLKVQDKPAEVRAPELQKLSDEEDAVLGEEEKTEELDLNKINNESSASEKSEILDQSLRQEEASLEEEKTEDFVSKEDASTVEVHEGEEKSDLKNTETEIPPRGEGERDALEKESTALTEEEVTAAKKQDEPSQPATASNEPEKDKTQAPNISAAETLAKIESEEEYLEAELEDEIKRIETLAIRLRYERSGKIAEKLDEKAAKERAEKLSAKPVIEALADKEEISKQAERSVALESEVKAESAELNTDKEADTVARKENSSLEELTPVQELSAEKTSQTEEKEALKSEESNLESTAEDSPTPEALEKQLDNISIHAGGSNIERDAQSLVEELEEDLALSGETEAPSLPESSTEIVLNPEGDSEEGAIESLTDEEADLALETDARGPVNQAENLAFEPPLETSEDQEENEAPSFGSLLKQLNKQVSAASNTEKAKETKEELKPVMKSEIAEKIGLMDAFVQNLPDLKKRKLKKSEMIASPEFEDAEEPSQGISLVTETLAKVYIKQGHFKKAIQAYEILWLKYPEKSSFFASRISDIKKLSNSKK